MDLRADLNKRTQYQQAILRQQALAEKKRKRQLWVIYGSLGVIVFALVLIGYISYKYMYAPQEYQLVAPPSNTVAEEAPKVHGTEVVVEGKTYENVQAFLDRDKEPPVPIPRDDLPAGTVSE